MAEVRIDRRKIRGSLRSVLMRYAMIVTTFSFALTMPAHADWQYTKWGMSPQQVVTASAGKAKPYPEGPKKATSANGEPLYETLFALHRSGPFSFRASFAFAERRGLTVVGLTAENPSDCIDIKNSLISKYGTPAVDRASVGLQKWFDQPSNNIVSIITLGSFCTIQYQPFSRAGGSDGL